MLGPYRHSPSRDGPGPAPPPNAWEDEALHKMIKDYAREAGTRLILGKKAIILLNLSCQRYGSVVDSRVFEVW